MADDSSGVEAGPAVLRSKAQKAIRQIDPNDRVGACGRVPAAFRPGANGAPPVDGQLAFAALVEWLRSLGLPTRAGGLIWCANAWCCPDCWTGGAMHYASLVTEAVARVQATGGWAFYAVLTVPHSPGDPLGQLWSGVLRKAWSHMTQRAAWKHWCAARGVDAWCAGTEVNYSPPSGGVGGWHPHDNVIGLIPGQAAPSDLVLEEMETELYVMWRDALTAVGWAHQASRERAVTLGLVDEAAAVGRYLFKHAGLEFAAPSGTKQGLGAGSMPARDLPIWLVDVCRGEPVRQVACRNRDVRLRVDAWSEYRDAARGQESFRSTKSFWRWVTCDRMGFGEIRKQAGDLQREDRARVERTLVELGYVTARLEDEANEEKTMDEPEAEVMLSTTPDAFVTLQSAYDGGAAASKELLLPVMQARARGFAFHAAVSWMIDTVGSERTARLLLAMTVAPLRLYRRDDAGGSLVIAHPGSGYPGEDVTEAT